MDCVLREWRLDDAKSLSGLLNNKKIMNNLRDGLPYPYTVDDARNYISSVLNSDKNSTFVFAVVCNNEVVGCVGVFRKDNVHSRTAEIGYYVGEQYWNKGIATCAVKKACDYVFENTDIVRIFAEPYARNAASCKVLEKSGFDFEGTLRSNAVKNGVIEDMKMYAKLRNI